MRLLTGAGRWPRRKRKQRSAWRAALVSLVALVIATWPIGNAEQDSSLARPAAARHHKQEEQHTGAGASGPCPARTVAGTRETQPHFRIPEYGMQPSQLIKPGAGTAERNAAAVAHKPAAGMTRIPRSQAAAFVGHRYSIDHTRKVLQTVGVNNSSSPGRQAEVSNLQNLGLEVSLTASTGATASDSVQQAPGQVGSDAPSTSAPEQSPVAPKMTAFARREDSRPPRLRSTTNSSSTSNMLAANSSTSSSANMASATVGDGTPPQPAQDNAVAGSNTSSNTTVGLEAIEAADSMQLVDSCPAPAQKPPAAIANQEALRSCPMVVANIVQDRMFGWQLVWRHNQHSALTVAGIKGAVLLMGTGAGGPNRVVNSYANPNISAAGGITNFTLVEVSRTTTTASSDASSADATPAAGPKANLDWAGVYINGQYCAKIPARSFLLQDCDVIRLSNLSSTGNSSDVRCLSIYCCGDFEDPSDGISSWQLGSEVEPGGNVTSPSSSPATPQNSPSSGIVGTVLTPVGAAIQDFTKGLLDLFDPASRHPSPSPSPSPSPMPPQPPSPSPSPYPAATNSTTNVTNNNTTAADDQGSHMSLPGPEAETVNTQDGKKSPSIVLVVVPSVVGSLLLAGLLAAVWARCYRKEIVKQLSADQQSLQEDVAAVLGSKVHPNPDLEPHGSGSGFHPQDGSGASSAGGPSSQDSRVSGTAVLASAGKPPGKHLMGGWAAGKQHLAVSVLPILQPSVSSPPAEQATAVNLDAGQLPPNNICRSCSLPADRGGAPQETTNTAMYLPTIPNVGWAQLQQPASAANTGNSWRLGRTSAASGSTLAQSSNGRGSYMLPVHNKYGPDTGGSRGSTNHRQPSLASSGGSLLPAMGYTWGSVTRHAAAMLAAASGPSTNGSTMQGGTATSRGEGGRPTVGLATGSADVTGTAARLSAVGSTRSSTHSIQAANSTGSTASRSSIGGNRTALHTPAASSNSLANTQQHAQQQLSMHPLAAYQPQHLQDAGQHTIQSAVPAPAVVWPGSDLPGPDMHPAQAGLPATAADALRFAAGRPAKPVYEDPICGLPLASLIMAAQCGPLHGGLPEQSEHPHHLPNQHMLVCLPESTEDLDLMDPASPLVAEAAEQLNQRLSKTERQLLKRAATSGVSATSRHGQVGAPARGLTHQGTLPLVDVDAIVLPMYQTLPERHSPDALEAATQAPLNLRHASMNACDVEQAQIGPVCAQGRQREGVGDESAPMGPVEDGSEGGVGGEVEDVMTPQWVGPVMSRVGSPLPVTPRAGQAAVAQAGAPLSAMHGESQAGSAAGALQQVSAVNVAAHAPASSGSMVAVVSSTPEAAAGTAAAATAGLQGQPSQQGQTTRWAAIDFTRDILLQRKLGSGAFGTVYSALWRDAPPSAHALLAHSSGLNQDGAGACDHQADANLPVAIKVVPLMLDNANYSARSLDALKQEIQILSQLNHPHVIRFLGAALAPPNVCIVEQLAVGGSVHTALHGQTPSVLQLDPSTGLLPYAEVLRLGCEIASAMAYLHHVRVVHRDLKAANILLDAQGHALVADFGIAKFRGRTFLSTRNVHAGTPAYMAPEQFEGRPVSEHVDQWAFGVLMWELLTRQVPWADLDLPMQIIFVVGVQGERLTLPAHCPAPLASLIKACWHEDPARRPPFAHIEQQLRELLAEQHG